MGFVTLGLFLLGWIFGERKKRRGHWIAFINFSKPIHIIIAFCIYFSISVLLGIFIPSCFWDIENQKSLFWYLIAVFFILLPSFNFIVYFIKIKNHISLKKLNS
jgi:hypothetical protein